MSDNYNELNELLTSADAKLWANEFVKRVKDNPAIATDEQIMIGWFANAIMTGYDFAQKKYQSNNPDIIG